MICELGLVGPARTAAEAGQVTPLACESQYFQIVARGTTGALGAYIMRHNLLAVLGTLSLAALPAARGRMAGDELGIEGPLEPTAPMGKEDNAGRAGLLVATNTSRTQVWTAKNKWEDRDTAAARKPGLAWGEQRPQLGREVRQVARVARVDPVARRLLDDRSS